MNRMARKSLSSTTYAFIFLVSMLPAGAVFGINIKFVALSALMMSLVLNIFSDSFSKRFYRNIAPAFIMIIVLGIWLLLGLINIYQFAAQEYINFASTIFVVAIAISLVKEKIIIRDNLFKYIIIGNIIYCLFKLFTVILVYFGFFTFADFTNLFSNLGTRPVTLEIIPRLIRVQTISDIITPFALYCLLTNKNLFKPLLRNLFIIIMIVSIAIAYARGIWLISAIVAVMHFLRQSQFKSYIYALVVSLLSVIAFTYNIDSPRFVESRFESGSNTNSDRTRQIQVIGLIDKFDRSIIVGSGMGAYVNGVIRDKEAPYSYEVQWLSFLMQLGIIGISVVLLPILYGIVFLFKSRRYDWLLLYLIWLVLGFTNPYLISSASGVVFILCIMGGVSKYGFESRDSLSHV